MPINNDAQKMFRRELMYKRILNWLEHNKPDGFSILETYSNHPNSTDVEYHFIVSPESFTAHVLEDSKNSFRLVFIGNMNFVGDFTLQFQFEKIITPTRILSLHSFKKKFLDVDDSDIISFSKDVELLVKRTNEMIDNK